jgi:hypothetical protein
MRRREEGAGNRPERAVPRPRINGIEPDSRDGRVARGEGVKFRGVRRVERDLEGADAAILDVEGGVPRDARDPLVIKREAAHAEVEQRSPLMRLHIRGEHACGRLRRAAAWLALVDHDDGDLPHRQFAGDGGPDHPRADDQNGDTHSFPMSERVAKL